MYSEEEYFQKADKLIRISCQAVQGVFRDNWKLHTGKEWTESSSTEFIKGIGRTFYSNARPIQKRLIATGKVEEWDLTLFSGIFNLKWFSSQNSVRALQNLCTERNKLSHNVKGKISAAAYQEVEDTVRQSLTVLGITSDQIEKWISDADVTPSVAAQEQCMKMQDLGDREIAKGKYEEAIRHYNEALLIPGLPPGSLCTLYEQRAACYLELGKCEKNENTRSDIYNQAMADVLEALNNNDGSLKAHFILAKIYKAINELDKAIEHFTKALAICPAQTNLKEELDDCKLVYGAMLREDHMDPGLQPQTLAEVAGYCCQWTGLSSDECLQFVKETGDDSSPGLSDAFKGAELENGWNGEQNYEEAAHHYKNAIDKGNAWATFLLTRLYEEGKGVPKDIPCAIELLKKAASMPEKVNGKGNYGVELAQHSLALKYQCGVGVAQDYEKAVDLYTKAASSGLEQAANNLAVMYYHGWGVTQDFKMAEMYWKAAAERGMDLAAKSLCIYYTDELEPDLATLWLEIATQLNHNRISFDKEAITRKIDLARKMRKDIEDNVNRFEKDHDDLEKHGLTFRQRKNRMKVAQVYQVTKDALQIEKVATERAEEYAKFLESQDFFCRTKNPDFTDSVNFRSRTHAFSPHLREIMASRAAKGSLTAQRVMTVFGYNEKLLELWARGREERAEEIIELLYEIAGFMESPMLSKEIEAELKTFVKSQFETHCSVEGELDKKVRICYAMWGNDLGQPFAVEVVKEGMRRYPDEPVYYEYLAHIYSLTKDYKAGLEVALTALQRFPNNHNFLLSKAFHFRKMRNTSICREERIKAEVRAYQDFIDAAPEDHRMVPDAYYHMARIYSEARNNEDAEKKMVDFYELGKLAEEKQLPIYLPYETPAKAYIMSLVMSIENSKTLTTEKADTGELPRFLKTPSKYYLKDPRRIAIRKEHRTQQNLIHEDLKKIQKFGGSKVYTVTPLLQHKMPENLVGLQAITLAEMNPTKEKVYQNKALNLTIIENPMMYYYPGIHLVAVDDNKDTARLSIHNLPHNEEVREKLGIGCKMTILNPYMKIARLDDGKIFIRVDEPDCIIFMGKVDKMCVYCGQEKSKNRCVHCPWANYCSMVCQVADWKQLKHKLICNKYID